MTSIRNHEIGFIFQNYQLIPTYNVMQNIIMPLLIRGMSSDEAEEQCVGMLCTCWGSTTACATGRMSFQRRPETACIHRPGPGRETGAAACRRADRRAGPGERQAKC
jgi:ABC-type dipeptide/oligopeptide/nickel transport system ATPase component